jgi:kynureninase
MDFENSLEFARHLDANDELKSFRERFRIPQHLGRDAIYFTGNSLGLQPKTVSAYVQQELDDWGKMGVEGHLHARNPWLPYHEAFPGQLGKIVGAKETEVVAMNSLTVNLHLLLVTFYRPTKKRFKIICEAKAFPSDQYAFESQVRFHGYDPAEAIIEVSPREGESLIRNEDILDVISKNGNETAIVLFGAVNYYSGQYFDLATITEAGHKAGAYVGFDCAHAAGNVILKLNEWNVDFACWCSYKYLNSGPGGVGGIFIHERHATNISLPRFAGWWGYTKSTRFQMQKGFEAIPTAEGWQLSNAPVLSMAAHKAALDIFEEAGMSRLLTKSRKLASFLHFILRSINEKAASCSLEVITPANENERGCQVSMLIPQGGKTVFEALTSGGVIADWREPNVIRVAPVPLYNTFEEVYSFGSIIADILK